MKILITGSSGFIGTCLSSHFYNLGHCVLALDKVCSPNRPYSTVCVDMLHYDELHSVLIDFLPDVIINLAARTDLNSSSISDYTDNTLTLQNLCRAVKHVYSSHTPLRIVHFSSMLVHSYGDQSYSIPTPGTAYGLSKLISEHILLSSFPLSCNIHLSICRPTSIWGPGFKEPYRNFFDSVLSGSFFDITNFSVLRSFGFIYNLAYQVERLLSSQFSSGMIFYLADYTDIDLFSFARTIRASAGLPPLLRLPGTPPLVLAGSICQFAELILPFLRGKLPLNKRRVYNLTHSWTHDTSLIQSIAPNLPYDLESAISVTLQSI